MLRWRLLLGAVLITAFAGVCWLDFHAARPGIWLAPVSLVVGLLASGELLWLLRTAGIEAQPLLVYLGNFWIVWSSWAPLWCRSISLPKGFDWPTLSYTWPALAFVTCVAIAFGNEIFSYRQPGGVTGRLAATTFALAYVGLLLSFVVLLRSLPAGNGQGMVALLSLILVVKLCDIGAYTVGRLLGRHKMAPYLSPGKTIEGAIGGIVFAVAGAWIAIVWLLPRVVGRPVDVRPWQWISFGVIVGGAAILGDLAESLLKRDLGRKDSSTWLPGFGGVLDIIDSVLFAAPFAYACWQFLLAGL